MNEVKGRDLVINLLIPSTGDGILLLNGSDWQCRYLFVLLMRLQTVAVGRTPAALARTTTGALAWRGDVAGTRDV